MRLIRFTAPSEAELEAARRDLSGEELSHSADLLERATPAGMRRDRLNVSLGSGEACWRRACAAIEQWAPFAIEWLEIVTGGSAPVAGLDVVVHGTIWNVHVLSGCRVVDAAVDVRSSLCGFTYGSLSSHVEAGVERFEVVVDEAGAVSYRIDVIAQPGRWYTAALHPLVERYRRRFRRDSAAAMRRAVAG